MAIEASIKIQYFVPWEKSLSIIEIIQMLLSEGWIFNDENGCSYLPLGEIESFNWVVGEKILPETLINILKEKEKLNEPIGVMMTWQDTGVGGLFMFRRPQEFSVLLNINRKIICDEHCKNITDASWYLSHLIPILEKNGIHVVYFALEQLA